MLHPAMKVVPMGWNWAMFIAQRVHQHQSMLCRWTYNGQDTG